jgi:tetratricopeptide (TPR) repeat protein
MAIVFKRQKKIDDAINWYQKAIEVNPRYSYAYNNLANIYKDQMKYE